MKKIFSLLLIISTVAQAQQQEIYSAIHTGAGMGYDSQTGESVMQFSAGANLSRLYISLNRSYPLDRNNPTLTQLRAGVIMGGSGVKALPYAGLVRRVMDFKQEHSQSMELYPERYVEYKYTALMGGMELSYPLAPKTRLFVDLNFNSRPLERGKQQLARGAIQFVPVLGFKAAITGGDECYPVKIRSISL